jgi:hypothetical protein
MWTKWFSFYWHGHRRGSLKFEVLYNPENNHIKYDSISTSHLEYLKSISKKHEPSYLNLSYNPSHTVRQTICEIFKENEAIADAYEKHCRSFETYSTLLDFSFSEFEWIGDKTFYPDMTFQEK